MNVLTKENYLDKINSMTSDDWNPLIDLISVIEKTKTFHTPGAISYPDEDTVEIESSKQASVIYTFLDIVYEIPIIIDFDWGSWDEGREIASDPNFDYDLVDIPTKCKLITAFVRNDRFCDGALAERFEDGTILKLLRSIKKKIS
ncbi:MAG: hypothetical protein JJU37_16510 [Balneolaceae bacterium]|nr:hypothetical protein [Balneolaceae bacterium]